MPDNSSARRFEIAVRREGRWLIDCLAATEIEARSHADALYAEDGVEAVRIVRGRFGQDGTTFETVILEREHAAQKGAPPVRIAAAPADEAWCENLDDFYGPASRRAISRLLRNFLDRHAITPTELLHQHRYIRLLERQEMLLPQAVQRMAAVQAKSRSVTPRARADVIDRLVDEASVKARDALSSRAAPRLGEGGLKELVEAVAGVARAPADQAFYVRFAVTTAWQSIGDPLEKLASAASWAADAPPALHPLIDELVAGLLGSAALVKDALGSQADLAAALRTLADFAAGRDPKAPAALLPFVPLLAAASMPETRREVLDRIERELVSDKPLSREAVAGQRKQFEAILDRLIDAQGLFVGGPSMVAAIARRSRRLEIIGGVETMAAETGDPAADIEAILARLGNAFADRQQRALATCLAAAIDACGDGSAPDAALGPRIETLRIAPPLKAALLARLVPQATAA